MKTVSYFNVLSRSLVAYFLVTVFTSSTQAETTPDLMIRPDIHSQIKQYLQDYDFSVLPAFSTQTVTGSILIDRENRIVIKEINAATAEIEAELRRHLENQFVYNVDDFRGKKVSIRITLKRRN